MTNVPEVKRFPLGISEAPFAPVAATLSVLTEKEGTNIAPAVRRNDPCLNGIYSL